MSTTTGRNGYILGLDAGQTSTKAILAGVDVEPVMPWHGGPVDHFRQRGARRRNEAVIREAVDALCRAAGIPPDAIRAAAVGWTAIRPGAPEIAIVTEIFGLALPQAQLAVVPDYVISFAGATAGEPGILVIAGGGSIAYGVADDGREAVVGGLGYLLGDEGSAYDIGRRAVAAAARSSDGRDRRTALEGLIRETFDLTEIREITRLVYAEDFPRARLAQLAPLVAELAEAGDTVAGEIMTYAGEELARAALAVAAKLNLPRPAIYTAGGVFRAGETVLRPFRETIGAALPDATVSFPAYPPVFGALLLARRMTGEPDDPALLSRVAPGLGPEVVV